MRVVTPLVGVVALVLLSAACGDLHAQDGAAAVRADADLRPGYHGLWRSDRDGGSSDRQDLRARARVGLWWTPTSALGLRGRIAGRLSTDQATFRFYLRDHVPTVDGLRQGEFTLDEAYLRWRPGDRLQLRVGRMQTSFELAGVPRKSLDRNDSPNTDVSWTDGLHASFLLRQGLRHHLILQRNGSEGASNTARGPLDFSGDRSRVTLFAALHLDDRSGPFIQREVDLTYIPGVVPRVEEGGERGDYLTLVVRGAVQPAVVLGGRLVLGGEIGAAAGPPPRVLLGTGTAEDGPADGWAFQMSANIMDVRDRHSFGIALSQAGDGWLISSDIRDNNREVEARYYWQYASWGRLDVRGRLRTDMYRRVGAIERRLDRDVYVRTTLRF
jgi:hypothetical protein